MIYKTPISTKDLQIFNFLKAGVLFLKKNKRDYNILRKFVVNFFLQLKDL